MSRARRPGRRSTWAHALCVALALLASTRCSGRDSAPVPVDGVPGAQLPGQRPAWLAPLQQAHESADAATTPALRLAALAAFDRALDELPRQTGGTGFTDAQIWVRQDALARAAELELDLGRADRAVARVDRALEFGTSASVPLATLHTLRGRALEALGETEAAIGAYHAALIANQQLMDRALDANESGAP